MVLRRMCMSLLRLMNACRALSKSSSVKGVSRFQAYVPEYPPVCRRGGMSVDALSADACFRFSVRSSAGGAFQFSLAAFLWIRNASSLFTAGVSSVLSGVGVGAGVREETVTAFSIGLRREGDPPPSQKGALRVLKAGTDGSGRLLREAAC